MSNAAIMNIGYVGIKKISLIHIWEHTHTLRVSALWHTLV